MTPPILATTIAGSLPKPAWLAPPRQLWAPWLLQGEALAEGKRDAVRLALREQEREIEENAGFEPNQGTHS